LAAGGGPGQQKLFGPLGHNQVVANGAFGPLPRLSSCQGVTLALMSGPFIVYTHTDEAPLLATYSFLPIIQAFAGQAGTRVVTRDISLAGRILAHFPEYLPEDKRVPDALAELGEMTQAADTNIIKLPNISASVPQLLAAISELQSQGFAVPNYPEAPASAAEVSVRERYDRVKGSAVNPVLRRGNSDRRPPAAVKAYAKRHPHRMGAWSPDSRTRVATMDTGDFRHNEKSVVMERDDNLSIRLQPAAGGEPVSLKASLPVLAGEVIDGTFMSVAALRAFLAEQIEQASTEGSLFSVHLKSTMMKVSDPIIFGHVVEAYLPEVFTTFADTFADGGISANDGLGTLLAKARDLDQGDAIVDAVARGLAARPPLAMVNSDKGITNLHVPSDVIIDASMAAMIRGGGKMWGPDGLENDTLAVIPDSSYAAVYQAVIEDCIAGGAFDPATLGTVQNVGLMAQAAEEYGSHDKTYLAPCDGVVEVVAADGTVLISHKVERGDIWRACQTKAAVIKDWVHLAVERARISGMPAVFWLDQNRPHDAILIPLVEGHLATENTDGLDLRVMAPVAACAYACQRMRSGLDTIAVTGNVLRDYLTDLFPILEVGTSAKMLSIVPLMAGGGMFETGAGGSAPKHVQQLVAENYLRWDSLGEFFALAASFEHFARVTGNPRAAVLAQTLDQATGRFLEENKSPTRSLGGIDNRGSHFFLAMYWAQELAAQTVDEALAATFAPVAEALVLNEPTIIEDLIAVQGSPAEIGGYYRPDPAQATAVMRPSATFNRIIDSI